VNDLTTRRSKE